MDNRHVGVLDRAPAPPVRELMVAEAGLATAGQRLRALAGEALDTGAHDPDAYDAAILTYRAAQARAVAARAAWLRWQAVRPAPAA
jgi:hypothetical protein